ncbi:hypothetical protein VB711_25900 [Cronbergia sp. UHCC 0137]|uniref:hypothetical protein n=1 Tax=Cronbergia sp. UHCC 0137 TaxID=3110239 RepID=UPI002B21BD78|nr:hypothetical protein [Cronbergia sp. UHCC 0137]MEA5621242.1 hypothetical protein [Cronbergia sp. UHCC 0137]
MYGDALSVGIAAMITARGAMPLARGAIVLRSNSKRDSFGWKRGETIASAGELMAFNGLTAEALTKRAIELVH